MKQENMSPEKMYSREAFEENEKKIDANRDLAQHHPFSGRADPAEIFDAKLQYISGKTERKRMLEMAHGEANLENIQHPLVSNEKKEQKKVYKVGDCERVILDTESGNRYIVQKNPSGSGYLVANTKLGTIELISSEKIENSQIKKGEQFFYGEGVQTSRVSSAKMLVYKK